MPNASPLHLTPRQIDVLQSLLKAGFVPVLLERFARYLGVERDGFIALLDPAGGKLKVFGQVGHRLGDGIGVLVERGAGKAFVWHDKSVAATAEMLLAYERFKSQLEESLRCTQESGRVSVSAIVLTLILGSSLFTVAGPIWTVHQAHRQIHPGMTLQQVLGIADIPLAVDGHSVETDSDKVLRAQRVQMGTYEIHGQGKEEKYATREEFFRALDRRMKESGVEWDFWFLRSAMPRPLSFHVRVGPDGRVRSVSEIHMIP